MADPQESAEHVFCTALDLPPEAREAYLDRVCKDAPNLRRLVGDLLRENDRAGSFMAEPLVRGVFPSAVEAEQTLAPSAVAAVETPPRFQPKQVIANRFVVVRFIARGGMGEVYEVQDTLLHGAPVALKLIRPEISADAASSHRFEQEVLLARKVVHPNLCPIYEIFRTDEDPPFLFLTMKLLEGETLDAYLRRSTRMPRVDIEQVTRQLIDGIAAIHAAGVIHRDLKPHNVMLERRASRITVSIMDFGLARLYESEVTLLGPGMVAGTPGYLAPELFRGEPPTQATDLFALGVMLHQLLTGERPLQVRDSTSVRPRPSLDRADAEPTLIAAVKDLLSDASKQRCLAFDRLAATSAPSRETTPKPWMSRRTFAISSGAFAFALAGGAVWKREQIYDLAHPLPRKRFVALLPWPPAADNHVRAMLLGLIDTISENLSRVEALDHDFFVAAEKTVSDLKTPEQLNEVRESLGTNLVLATSGRTDKNNVHIALHVMDPVSGQTLRSKEVKARSDDVRSLPQRVVRVAAELLDVAHLQQTDHGSDVGTNNPHALAAFQQAELLRKQDNDTGLKQAIEKYKEALDLDPSFAKAQAELGWAYIRSYGMQEQAAALVLARENCEGAAKLDPDLIDAHLGLAWLLETAGNHSGAMRELANTLSLDPLNVGTLYFQAQFYFDNGEFAKAEQAYRRVISLRPNLWLAHNDFGALLYSLGRYHEALSEYQTASMAAPKNALALSNIASVYLAFGDLGRAIDNAQRSFDLTPTDQASTILAEAFRIQKRSAGALKFAQRAVELNPTAAANWIELGDCHTAARDHGHAMESYVRAISTQQEELRNSPKYGPGWMLLAFCRARTGDADGAISAINKAQGFHCEDIMSQLVKLRIWEVLGRRDDSLLLAKACVQRGATRFQLDTMSDLQELRNDPRYLEIFSRLSPHNQSQA